MGVHNSELDVSIMQKLVGTLKFLLVAGELYFKFIPLKSDDPKTISNDIVLESSWKPIYPFHKVILRCGRKVSLGVFC